MNLVLLAHHIIILQCSAQPNISKSLLNMCTKLISIGWLVCCIGMVTLSVCFKATLKLLQLIALEAKRDSPGPADTVKPCGV